MSTRIGLYGGSFNPIHFGHLISARSVAEQCGLDRVLLIPAAMPPHKNLPDLAPAADRLAMVRLAVEGDGQFDVSDVELRREGPSYTIDTIAALRADWGPSGEFVWIIGADSLPELATWSRAMQLVETVRIVAARRPGWAEPDLTALRRVLGDANVERLRKDVIPTPAIEISATDIRMRIAAGRSVRYLLPDRVIEYIEARGLYRVR
ncbi:MAG: nicotinate-nucleotide adenylyltransferase [Phycisphaerae bacterium]|nr:nicotinate-nucleotide adenylyltransferase [Phycisphaerae bacterium]